MNVKALVNSVNQLKFSKYGVGLVLIVIIGLAYSQWQQQPKAVWQEDQVEIGLRRVGDLLLKRQGDGETPVPPIHQSGKYGFSLYLPNALALNPDYLADAALSTFDDGYFRKALVQVYADDTGDMVYGFQIDTRDQPEIPCLGRVLPEDHYQIKLKVLDPPTAQTELQVAMMSVAGFGLLVMLLSGFSGLRKEAEKSRLEVAGMQLDMENGTLQYQQDEVPLTQKEASLARILIENKGQLVTRDYLTEEVWAKDGVITGRSLDVFISRLRKKMAINPSVRIENRHGKGYVLETN